MPVLQLLHVTGRDRPVGEAADIQSQYLLSQLAASACHGLSVRPAVREAVGTFDLDAVLAPGTDQLMRCTGSDVGVALAALDGDAREEAALEWLADLGKLCCRCHFLYCAHVLLLSEGNKKGADAP